jgi:hypothetical protein
MTKKKEKPTIGHIYVLIDPITLQVRYVGQTTSTIHTRRDAHIYGAMVKKLDLYKDRWIRKRNGKIYVELVETLPVEQLDAAEIKWIKHYRDHGYPITNGTKGGDGTRGLKWRKQSREKLSKTKSGVPLSKAHRKAVSDGSIGKVVTEETKQNIAKGVLNWLKTHEPNQTGSKKTKKQKEHQGRMMDEWYKTHKNPQKGVRLAKKEIDQRSETMLEWLKTHKPNQLGVKQSKQTTIKRGLAISKTLALKRMLRYQVSSPEGIKFNPKQAVLHNLSKKQLAILAS